MECRDEPSSCHGSRRRVGTRFQPRVRRIISAKSAVLIRVRLYLTPVTFTLRNHSLTHPCLYVITFGAKGEEEPQPQVFFSNFITHNSFIYSNLLPPRYVGKLTIRGTLYPSQLTAVETRIRIDRPGTYALSGWQVETVVGEAHDQSSWRTRHRYVQGPPSDHHPCMVVKDIRQ